MYVNWGSNIDELRVLPLREIILKRNGIICIPCKSEVQGAENVLIIPRIVKRMHIRQE